MDFYIFVLDTTYLKIDIVDSWLRDYARKYISTSMRRAWWGRETGGYVVVSTAVGCE